MPKLLMFAPCEKVIVDKQSNNVSLIAVLQDLQLRLPDVPIPAKVTVPIRWHIFSMWLREPGDENRRYEQSCELVAPVGAVLARTRSLFSLEKPTHRVIVSMQGFPLAQSGAGGEYLLKLYLRAEREGAEPNEVATYPLSVEILAFPK